MATANPSDNGERAILSDKVRHIIASLEKEQALLTAENGLGVNPLIIHNYLTLRTLDVKKTKEADVFDSPWGKQKFVSLSSAEIDLAYMMFAMGADERSISSSRIADTLQGRKKGRSRDAFLDSTNYLNTIDQERDMVSRSALPKTSLAIAEANMIRVAARATPLDFLFNRFNSSKPSPEDVKNAEYRVADIAHVETIVSIQRIISSLRPILSRNASNRLQFEFTSVVRDMKDVDQVGLYALASDIVAFIQDLEKKEQDTLVRSYLSTGAGSVAMLVETYAKLFPGVAVAYQDMQKNAEQANKVVVNPPVRTDIAITVQTKETPVIEHAPDSVMEELAALQARIAEFCSQWFDSGKKWRENGYNSMVEDLVRNKHVFDKTGIAPGIGALQRLRDLYPIQQGGTDALLACMKEYSGLLGALENFLSANARYPEIREFRVKFSMPDLSQLINLMQQKWPQLSESISRHWPAGNGSQVAREVGAVLFNEQTSDRDESQPQTGEIEVLRDMFLQLDEVILPPHATSETIIAKIAELGGAVSDKINWEKLKDLITIRDEIDTSARIYRSKFRKHGEGQQSGRVYYVLEINLYGRIFAVAESPEVKNATYVIDEQAMGGSWREILAMYKDEVRLLGGRQIIHSTASPYGPKHREKIIDAIVKSSETISS